VTHQFVQEARWLKHHMNLHTVPLLQQKEMKDDGIGFQVYTTMIKHQR
jgi:hypothetical protein